MCEFILNFSCHFDFLDQSIEFSCQRISVNIVRNKKNCIWSSRSKTISFLIPLTRWPFRIPRRRRHLPEADWKSKSFPNRTNLGNEFNLFLDFVIFETLRRITKLFAKILLRNAHISHIDHKYWGEGGIHTQSDGVCGCGSSSNMFIFKDATLNSDDTSINNIAIFHSLFYPLQKKNFIPMHGVESLDWKIMLSNWIELPGFIHLKSSHKWKANEIWEESER